MQKPWAADRGGEGEFKNCKGENADDQEVPHWGIGYRHPAPTFWSTADPRLLFWNRPTHVAAGGSPTTSHGGTPLRRHT